MADKTAQCRYCGEEIKRTSRDGKSYWRHASLDNGRCEVLRRQLVGDSRAPVEPA